MKRRWLLCVSYCALSFTHAQSCPEKGVYLQVLGSGGPELDDQRASSGYAIWVAGKIRVLVDVGTGTAVNFGKTGQTFSDVEVVLFSHFHVDHSADFASFIKNSFFEQRQTDLHVFGPTGNDYLPSTTDFVTRLIGKNGVFPYLQSYLGDNASYKIHLNDVTRSDEVHVIKQGDLTLKSIDAEHGPFPSLAWRVELGNKSITFSGDNSGRSDKLVTIGKDTSTFVIHNAVPEDIFGVAKNLHLVPSRIGKIANASGTQHLVLSHFMKRTQDVQPQTQKHIEKNYDGKLSFAEDLSCYLIG